MGKSRITLWLQSYIKYRNLEAVTHMIKELDIQKYKLLSLPLEYVCVCFIFYL